MVRGRVIRVTALDPCGSLLPAGTAPYATASCLTSVSAEPRFHEKDTSVEVDDRGRVVHAPVPESELIGYTLSISMLEVNQDVLAIVSGNRKVLDGTAAESHSKRPTFALEVWTRLAGNACAGGRRWGYTLFPRVRGGNLSSLSIENAVTTFTMEGAEAQRGAKWGRGPYPTPETPAGDVSAYNRFWTTLTVGAHPQPGTGLI